MAACGCGGSGGAAGGGPPNGANGNAPGDDAGAGASADAAVVGDGYAPPPVGTQVQHGDNLSVRGVTSDGYLVYSDDAALEAYAMPFAGGTVQDLGALGNAHFWNDTHGNVEFLWANVQGPSSTGVGTLNVWSNATGLHTIATASFGIISAASAAGDHILYLDGVDQAGTVGDVYVAAPDGTGKTKLVSGISISTCFPSLAFAGSYALVAYCPGGSKAGNFASTLASFAGPSWSAGVNVPATSGSFWTDQAGTKVLYATAGGVSVAPLAGGASTLIDATGTNGFLSSDGQAAMYVTSSNAFKRSPTAPPSPTTLVPNGFTAWQGLSGDASKLLYYTHYTGSGFDLYVTSTSSPGATATISSATNNSVPGDPFTADSSHAIYASGGKLLSYSLADATSASLATNPFMNTSATGAKVVFTADYVSTGGLRYGRGNLYSVDTSQSAAPTQIAGDTDAIFYLSPAGDQIAYAWSAKPGESTGIYTIPVP